MTPVDTYLNSVARLLAEVPREDIQKAADLVVDAYKSDRQVFIMGNGGSAATASHLACDLQKSVGCAGRRRFKVMAVTDSVPLMTAWANDFDYADIFAGQLSTWINPGDLVIGISGSGNSPNVIKGIEVANEMGAVTIGLSGFGGGRLAQVAQHNVVIASEDMQQIEDVHMVMSHLIFRCVLEEIGA